MDRLEADGYYGKLQGATVMRQSQKAWVWRSNPALATGSPAEAGAIVKGAEAPAEIQVLKGRSRDLLPRT
ncbi:hypothetical protein A8L34_06860 [Bacillus sp. FJAT-27264]|uniref:hypothetical protein n=1 Tax=Paenibacillus sp. (strain DSM 101736 / FJAT-27264) TaxID=1850362 RepID=UPI000807B7E2|nr:hypothetical protein [Bacillus sp. FJAT-27264]OBZ19235.1 hypothetical protein A8L34_06860 [Bacillus sp. FJAT-27264]